MAEVQESASAAETTDATVTPAEFKPRPLNIIIITPCHGDPKAGMAWSVAGAVAWLMSLARDYGAPLNVDWQIMGGSNLCQQRQQLVSRALHLGATHILFWDADIKAPRDVIPRMLNHSKPFVCANYPTKELVSRPTVYLDGDNHTGPLWTKPGDTGLVGDVARAGLGLALVDAQVFYHIELPWFVFTPQPPEYILYGGEDHYLYDKVRAAGIPIFCDQDISNEVAHCGNFEFTNEWAVKAEETRQAIYHGEGEQPDSRDPEKSEPLAAE